VVDLGFMVDPVDWDTPNQPHNPNQPRYPARQPGKKGANSTIGYLAAPTPHASTTREGTHSRPPLRRRVVPPAETGYGVAA
jgi:hypothetical protein